MPTVRLRCRKDGPIVIEAEEGIVIEVVDSEGQPALGPDGKPKLALCRCGQSTTKPFCDGTHKAAGWCE